jgi:hypothetical protein
MPQQSRIVRIMKIGTIMTTRVVLTATALTAAPAAVPPTVAPATIPAPDYVLTSNNLT